MFSERRPVGLKIIVTLAILNSIVTFVHFFLIRDKVQEFAGSANDPWLYGIAVSITGILPLLLSAYGLYNKRLWSLGFYTFGSGSFMALSLVLLTLSIKNSYFGYMFFVSIYFILYIVISNFYLWSSRYQFRDF